MKARELHPWQLSRQEAEQLQRQLAARVSHQTDLGEVQLVAGVDVSVREAQTQARSAVVLLGYPALQARQVAIAETELQMPYIPGLLAFRELPAVLAAFAQIDHAPDLIVVDGQGIAHPRRFGIAAHLGLLLDLPTIGCAKSVLTGRHGPLSPEAGSWVEMLDRGEVVGAAVRTRTGVNPVYVSIGHRVDLRTAVKWILACARGYRLPEPVRMAHLAAAGKLPRLE